MSGLPVESLGLQTSSCRYLRAQGLRTVGEILAWDPAPLAGRSTTREDLRSALERLQARHPGAAELNLYIGRLTQLAGPPRPSPELPDMPPRLRELYRVLKARAHPLPLRELLRLGGGGDPALAREMQQRAEFVLYPYGLHRWTGLSEWGLRGYRRAARAAWNVLPIHLARLETEERLPELPRVAWEGIRDVALEEHDDELLALALEQLVDATAQEVREAPVDEERARFEEDLRAAVSRLGVEPVLFRGLTPEQAYHRAVEAIVTAARGLRRPFSLAELRTSLGDRRWLEQWARELPHYVAGGWAAATQRTVEIQGEKWSRSECLGLLLLFLAAEVARVRAREGHVWPVVHVCFDEAARAELFAGGQPRAVTRQAIEAGARRLGVRNAFGQEGTQSWYLTIFLQFGFTRQGIQALPVWLSSLEHATEAIVWLQRECPSFRQLWSTLRAYRAGRLDREAAEQALLASPFVLSSWIPEILKAARRILLDAGCGVQAVEDELPLFGSARLRWSGTDKPALVVPWHHLDGQGLTDSGYEVFVEGRLAGRLSRQVSGHYLAEPPELTLSLECPYVVVELEGVEGADRREVDLILWDTDEEVQVFEAGSGRRLGPDQPLSTRQDYLLWLQEGLSLAPTPAVWSRLPQGRGRLFRLEAGWEPRTAVQADGIELRRLMVEQVPDWLEAVRLVPLQRARYRLGDRVAVALLGLPRGTTVVTARQAGERVSFEPAGMGWEGELTLPASLTGPTVRVGFVVEHEHQRHRFSRSTAVEIRDAAIHLGENPGWQPFRGIRRATTQQLERAQVRFFLGDEAARYGLLEGTVFSQRPKRRVGRLAPLCGYGAALELREGPYNAPEPGTILVEEVVRQGWLEGIERVRGAPDTVEIHLQRPLEAGPDHFVILWTSAGELAALVADELVQARGCVWRCELEEPLEGRLALALGYEDAWLGTAWEAGFVPPWQASAPRTVAGMLRWMHFPLLGPGWREPARKFVADHPHECLSAWLFDRTVQGAPARLALEESEGWFSVSRELFANFPSSEVLAYELWTYLLHQKDQGLAWEDLFVQLLHAHPFLALRLAQHAPTLRLTGGWRRIRDRLAGLEDGRRVPLAVRVDELCRTAAQKMKVDDIFLRRLCERLLANRMSDKDRRNLHLACQLSDFAELLAVMLLDHWIRNQGQ